MKLVKSEFRSRITDAHLENYLRVATTSVDVDIDAFTVYKQCRCFIKISYQQIIVNLITLRGFLTPFWRKRSIME